MTIEPNHSVGVDHQYCGATGQANWPVTLSIADHHAIACFVAGTLLFG
jgi:hypothetical protein